MNAVIDPTTVTRGITYLYRWWIQAELSVIPDAYVRRGHEATLICPKWAVVGSASRVSVDEIARLQEDLRRPVFVCCPELPQGTIGFDLDSQTTNGLPEELGALVRILRERQHLLHQLGEEKNETDEWQRTTDAGIFKLWKARVRRLLLYPNSGQVYGFTMDSPAGDFIFRSRSCSEEGNVAKSGVHKMSEHLLPNRRRVNNLDLLFVDGTVALLHLTPAGAGFKVFPRRVPGFEASFE